VEGGTAGNITPSLSEYLAQIDQNDAPAGTEHEAEAEP
jgi:hypothetical protein